MNARVVYYSVVIACLLLMSGECCAWNQPPIARITFEDIEIYRKFVNAGENLTFSGGESTDPDGDDEELTYFWYVFGSQCGVYDISGTSSEDMQCKLNPPDGGMCMSATIMLQVTDEGGASGWDTCYVYPIDLDADADRDGDVEDEDEDIEDSQAALVVSNCDDDDGDKTSDNGTGDDLVNGEDDMGDLAEMHFHRVPYRMVFPGFTVKVSVDKVDTHTFFDDVEDEDIVRIFLRNNQTGSWFDKEAIIGPEGESYVEYDDDDPETGWFGEGPGIVEFRVEGIEFGATVDVTLTLHYYDDNASDTVRLRVAPFIVLPGSASADAVYAPDYVGKEEDYEIAALGSTVDVSQDSPYYKDPWLQDEVEIGYTKWPGGQMLVVWDLPRNRELDLPGAQEHWPESLLGPGCGHFSLDPGTRTYWHRPDYGGNIEATAPVTYDGSYRPCGIVVVGSGFTLTDFIEAQGVQPVLECSGTSFLSVGHIDEVVSFLGAESVLIANTDQGRSLIERFDRDKMDDSGTATGGSSNYLEDTAGNWTPDENEWAAGYVTIKNQSTQEIQVRQVVRNDATRVYVYDAENEKGTPWDPPFPGGGTWDYWLVVGTEDSGTATDGDSDYVEDSSQNWVQNQWAEGYVEIKNTRTSARQVRQIVKNDATKIYVYDDQTSEGREWDQSFPGSDTWEYWLVARSEYRAVFFKDEEDFGVVSAMDGYYTLIDETKDWTANKWQGGYIMVFAGPAGNDYDPPQTQLMQSSGSDNITVSGWSWLPDETCRYVLVQKSKMAGLYHDLYHDYSGHLGPACTTVRALWKKYEQWQNDCQSYLTAVETALTGSSGPFIGSNFTKVPALFDESSGASALIPGMVNLLNASGLSVPRPFGPRDEDGGDVFEENSNIGGYPCFVDSWPLHTGSGEIHCGTNAKRAIPYTKWWEYE